MRRLALLLAFLVAPLAHAQSVRGVVRDSASGAPVSGVIVMVLDSARLPLTRTLTNGRGEYQLQRAPAARIVRMMRLGFRPKEAPIPVSANDIVQVDIRLAAVAFNLETVRTIAAAACPKRNDSRAALALLEQARTGLLATVVAREARPAVLTRLAFIRMRNFDSDDIISMTVNVDSAQSTNSYGAVLTAQQFIETGFATDSAGILTAYGPDAEVLLDEAFANGYCFRLMDPEKARPNQVGLGFLPAEHKRGRIDIDGAVWLDTAARSLVDIEFLYRGFDKRFDPGKPGGHVEFRTMPNGVPLIDRWGLRMPTRDTRVTPAQAAQSQRRTASPGMRYSAVIQETGGELAHARWDDGTTWHASLGSVNMQLVTRQGAPDSGRVVSLDSTSYVAKSDSLGNVHIADLVPGPYKITFVDGRLAQIGTSVPAEVGFYAIRDSSLSFPVKTRTPFEYVRDLCIGDKTPVGTSAIIARILDDTGSAAGNVDIIIDEQTNAKRIAEDGMTDNYGRFHHCALSRGMQLIITASRGELKRIVTPPPLDPGLTVLQFKLKKRELEPEL